MRRPLIVLLLLAAVSIGSGCGGGASGAVAPDAVNEITSVAPQYRVGARLFIERCSGCHNLGVVGSEGGSFKPNGTERVDGPNFNVRKETVDNVLHAIRNGGSSGQIMPPNIVVGEEARQVAEFLAFYAGYGKPNDHTPDGNSRAYDRNK